MNYLLHGGASFTLPFDVHVVVLWFVVLVRFLASPPLLGRSSVDNLDRSPGAFAGKTLVLSHLEKPFDLEFLLPRTKQVFDEDMRLSAIES